MSYFESYTIRKQEIDEEYNFSYIEEEVKRFEKLEMELALVDNTPLTKSERDTEVKRVKDLYGRHKYKSEECIKYEEAIKEMEEVFFSDLKAQFGDVVDSVYNVCYARAYEKGHSNGYDEVANYLVEEVEYLMELEELLGIKIITK